MTLLRKIGEVAANGNRTTVRKATGELLGEFLPNTMVVHPDNPYDAHHPLKRTWHVDGATPDDWFEFKATMLAMNGRVIRDDAMPRFIQEQVEVDALLVAKEKHRRPLSKRERRSKQQTADYLALANSIMKGSRV